MKLFFKLILRQLGLEGIIGVLICRSALREDGWFLSNRKNKAIDKNNNQIPWFTYPCNDFLKDRITKNMIIFEYGIGGSSIWLSNLAGHVDSVEHNKKFYNWYKDKTNTISNIDIKYVPLEPIHNNLSYEELSFLKLYSTNQYVSSISSKNKKYDIIIVDGIFRLDCIFECINNINDSGVIILDNTNYMDKLSDAITFMEKHGFRRLDFWGMTPIIWAKSCTTIFYKNRNCFNI